MKYSTAKKIKKEIQRKKAVFPVRRISLEAIIEASKRQTIPDEGWADEWFSNLETKLIVFFEDYNGNFDYSWSCYFSSEDGSLRGRFWSWDNSSYTSWIENFLLWSPKQEKGGVA